MGKPRRKNKSASSGIMWRRFELLTENEQEKIRLERVLRKRSLSRRDLAVILFHFAGCKSNSDIMGALF